MNVRRLASVIETSIQRSLQWVVFEPHDRNLWRTVKLTVSIFLQILWREGGLMGTTPEEAFFVKCDEETNPPEAVAEGQLSLVIGLAMVKPAEFTIFQVRKITAS